MAGEGLNHYPRRSRQANAELLRPLFESGSESNDTTAVFRQAAQDFHPSIISEFDFVVGNVLDGSQTSEADSLGLQLFLYTLPANLRLRYSDSPEWPLIEALLQKHSSLFNPESEADPSEAVVLDFLGGVGEVRPPIDVTLPHTFATLAEMATRIKDYARLAGLFEVVFSNYISQLLDDIFLRIPTQQFLRYWTKWSAFTTRMRPGSDNLSAYQTFIDLAVWLSSAYEWAAATGLAPVATAVDKLLDVLKTVDITSFDEKRGSWYGGKNSCGRCSMFFKSMTMGVIDESSDFIRFFGKDFLFLPPGFGRSKCQFCGHEAGKEVPVIFYSESRNQIIYCAYSFNAQYKNEQLENLYMPIFRALIDRYLSGLDTDSAIKFSNATEIVAQGWDEFLYAFNMADITPEAHVLSIVRLDNGYGVVVDVTKGFAKILNPQELSEVPPRSPDFMSNISTSMPIADGDDTPKQVLSQSDLEVRKRQAVAALLQSEAFDDVGKRRAIQSLETLELLRQHGIPAFIKDYDVFE